MGNLHTCLKVIILKNYSKTLTKGCRWQFFASIALCQDCEYVTAFFLMAL